MLPKTAVAKTEVITKIKGWGKIPVAQSKPAVNKSESPGRKKPKNKPFSINTTANNKIKPPFSMIYFG